MTKSEMWNVPPERIDALLSEAASRGVIVMKLDQKWNHALAPMQDGDVMTQSQKDMMQGAMQSKAAMGMSMMALPQASVVEYALTKGMNDKAAGKSKTSLIIPLNSNVTVTAERTSISKTSDGYVWRGVVAGSEDLVTLMWWPSGRLTGTVAYKGHVYSVKSMGGSMHGVIEIAPNSLPPEHAPMDRGTMKKMNMKSDPLVKMGDASMMLPRSPDGERAVPGLPPVERRRNLEDAPAFAPADPMPMAPFISIKPAARQLSGPPAAISLLVAYTKEAAKHYSDIEKDLIALAIEDTNQSFRNSGIGHVRVELAHAYQTDYTESGTHFEHVFRSVYKDDGYVDDVHALRERYRADVAVLIVHDPNGCGLAAQVAAPEDRAFAVVHHECAATSYSLAHEIGHLIGARHDKALDESTSPFPYGHGFVHGNKWRTMMSYKESCGGCQRLPVWSNPDVKIRGVRAGNKITNNARVLSEQAARVAAFR